MITPCIYYWSCGCVSSVMIYSIRRLSSLHSCKIWHEHVNYCKKFSLTNHSTNANCNYPRHRSITSQNNSHKPATQSLSRWIRSLILFWVNKQSHGTKIRDLHAIDNLNELCIYLSNIQIKDSTGTLVTRNDKTKEQLLAQRFETLYLLHKKLLVRELAGGTSIKHLVITLNSYTRLKSLFPGHINQIYVMSQELVESLATTLTYNAQPLVNINEQDVSLLLNGMSKLNIRHKIVLKLLENLLLRQLENKTLFVETFSPQGISLVLNAFQKFDWTSSPYLLMAISQFALKIIKKFTLTQLSVTCHALWKLQLSDVYIKPLLKHLDKTLATNDDEIDLKILSISLYTFGKLEYFPELSKDIITRGLAKECSENLDNYGVER